MEVFPTVVQLCQRKNNPAWSIHTNMCLKPNLNVSVPDLYLYTTLHCTCPKPPSPLPYLHTQKQPSPIPPPLPLLFKNSRKQGTATSRLPPRAPSPRPVPAIFESATREAKPPLRTHEPLHRLSFLITARKPEPTWRTPPVKRTNLHRAKKTSNPKQPASRALPRHWRPNVCSDRPAFAANQQR